MPTKMKNQSTPKQQDELLVREVTWRDKLIDHEMLATRIPLYSKPFVSSNNHAGPAIGNLENVPLELFIEMLGKLSVADVLNLCRVNSRMQSLVFSWPPFAVVGKYGSNAIRVLIALGKAHEFTFPDLERVVVSELCEICGGHGEILYVPKLVRCCFRCLSTDRRLLAVHAGYAETVLKVPESDLRQLPVYHTIPHEQHWGFSLGRVPMVDYTTAIQNSKASSAVPPPHSTQTRPQLQATTLPTEFDLPEKERSLQPRPEESLQARRRTRNHLPLLSVPSAVIRPHEGPSGQHACSIYLPAVKRISRFPLRYKIEKGQHCAGCAHWWNYHATMPFEYHTMYQGSVSDSSSPLAIHLSKCIYAHIFRHKAREQKLLPPMLLVDYHRRNKLRINRWSGGEPAQNAEAFERIDRDGLQIISKNKKRADSFSCPTIWPVEEQVPGVKEHIEVPAVKRGVADEYGDMLFGSEALSQSNWATAKVMGNTDMFWGPVNLVNAKRQREQKMIEKMRRHGENVRGIWGGKWQFDLFG